MKIINRKSSIVNETDPEYTMQEPFSLVAFLIFAVIALWVFTIGIPRNIWRWLTICRYCNWCRSAHFIGGNPFAPVRYEMCRRAYNRGLAELTRIESAPPFRGSEQNSAVSSGNLTCPPSSSASRPALPRMLSTHD